MNRLPEMGSAVKLLKRCFALISSQPLPGHSVFTAQGSHLGKCAPFPLQCPGEGEQQRLSLQDEGWALLLSIY